MLEGIQSKKEVLQAEYEQEAARRCAYRLRHGYIGKKPLVSPHTEQSYLCRIVRNADIDLQEFYSNKIRHKSPPVETLLAFVNRFLGIKDAPEPAIRTVTGTQTEPKELETKENETKETEDKRLDCMSSTLDLLSHQLSQCVHMIKQQNETLERIARLVTRITEEL